VTKKQAKILSPGDERRVLSAVREGRYAARDRVMILLSLKAGLRAGEIAALTWPMVLNAHRKVDRLIALHNRAAKKGSGRVIPMHPLLQAALEHWRKILAARGEEDWQGPVILSERGKGLQASSVATWFFLLYRRLGLAGCSSHSGRRTFVTRAARLVHKAGGSLRDVQQLAGHRSIEMTQRYIEGDSPAQHRLVRLL
jgi:integrase